jgi:ribosomal-protein-alanine N-acetyltransferase
MGQNQDNDLNFVRIDEQSQFPAWAPRDDVARFFHETMKPYNDTLEDVQSALSYALEKGCGAGGFLMLTHRDEKLLGALLMLRTGMAGYVPENILLFVTVDPSTRGQGIGGRLIRKSIAECDGDVKLHVEYDNPAKRLYERLGFTTKYAEMRYSRDQG